MNKKCVCGKTIDSTTGQTGGEQPRFSESNFCSMACAQSELHGYLQGYGVLPISFQYPYQKLDRIARLNGSVLKTAIAWSDFLEWDGGPKDGLLLHGKISGTGKTRIGSVAFHLDILTCFGGEKETERRWRRTDPFVWMSAGKLTSSYQQVCMKAQHKADLQANLTKCETLFLDDLDKVKPTEGLMEMLFSVIDDRFSSDEGRTIITTNLTGPELAERWGKTYGPYLVRRLADYCTKLNCDEHANLEG